MQQLSLFPEDQDDWNPDDWQTPNEVAGPMSELVKPSDRNILEPCAGTGQIVKYLVNLPNKTIHANERSYSRCKQGRLNTPSPFSALWMNLDFLSTDWQVNPHRKELLYDLIITNPPFSQCVEFIERSLSLLNPNNPEARLLFLLPLDWNCSLERGRHWQRLNAHIHHEHRIMGRVHYLDASGIPQKKRQIYDAVFDIRPGVGGFISYLGEAR